MFTVFFIKKELYTGEGCVEMDIPWQICRTISTLTLVVKRLLVCFAMTKQFQQLWQMLMSTIACK